LQSGHGIGALALPLLFAFAPVIFAPHSEQKSSSEEECPFGQE
jgi:hypothetical protein